MPVMRFGDADVASTGAFLVGELERFDPQIYEPIADFTWSRDVPVREDVTIADEVSSFITSEYAGGTSGTGHGTKAWASQKSGTIPKIDVGFTKTTHPIIPWAMDVSYSIIELQKAMQAGRPIDTLKLEAMRMKHQRDIDEQVYIGDTETGATGLLNDPSVGKGNIGTFDPDTASADDFLDMINTVLKASYQATEYNRVPDTILLPPDIMTFLSKPMVVGGTPLAMTVADWVRDKSLTYTVTGKALTMNPCRWLRLNGGYGFDSGRIVAYTNARDVVRFPLVKMQNTPVQFRGLDQSTIYYAALGQVEVVRPEMVYYGDMAD